MMNEEKSQTITKTFDLIKAQEELLAIAQKMPGATEEELAVRNRKIESIQAEINRLKELGGADEAEAAPPPPAEQVLLEEIRDILKEKGR